jgi:O-acetyl-ADP-ribose deacetylase (regulator of RNase III)
MQISAILGDLTKIPFDAVVNAANAALAGGGGLDGAIHRAAGPELMDACRMLPAVRGVRCPAGEARLTPGFRLPSQAIIHAVGPVYATDPHPEQTLTEAYRSSLSLAEAQGFKRVGLPALSCGIYGFPPKLAAPISVRVCRERDWALEEAVFVLMDQALLELWKEAIARY